MELKKTFLINSLIGIVAGMIVGLIFWMTSGPDTGGRSFLLHMVASAVHGLIPMGAATVYSIESWGLTKSTAVHAILTLAAIVGIELPMKWFPLGPEFAIAMAVYVVVYVIIWLTNYLYWKRTVREMNEQLKALHRSEDTDRR